MTLALVKTFPTARVVECEENVASMTGEELQRCNERQGVEPYCLDLGDLTRQRRRRLFWPTWRVRPSREVVVTAMTGYKLISLKPKLKLDDALWVTPGWQVGPHVDLFPTVTRPCPVDKPRWKTPGVDQASPEALLLWQQDAHRRPPLHYEPVL